MCRVPYVSLASLAAVLLDAGHTAKILDLSVSRNPPDDLQRMLRIYRPHWVGVTFTIGLTGEAAAIAARVKAFDPSVLTVAGGAHPSVFPAETVQEYDFDYAVFGEGEITLRELVDGQPPSGIRGLAFRGDDGKVVLNPPRELMEDLDSLPYPAFYLYNARNYFSPRITARRSPAAAIETSRGCPFNCIFCNKRVFQRKVRTKSPERVVDEIPGRLSAASFSGWPKGSSSWY